jgi:hypothetical protein
MRGSCRASSIAASLNAVTSSQASTWRRPVAYGRMGHKRCLLGTVSRSRIEATGKEGDVGSADENAWLKSPLKRLFPKRWRRIYVILGIIGGAAVAASKLPELLSKGRGALTPDVEFVTVMPSPEAVGIYEIAVRNRTELPVVITGIGVEVLAVRPSDAKSSGNATLPVQDNFDVGLPTKPGERVVIDRVPTSLPAKDVERIRVRFSAVAIGKEAWTDFDVRLTLRNGEQVVADSKPLSVRVFPRVR